MDFTDVPLNEICQKDEFHCEIHVPSPTPAERFVKVIVTAESVIIKDAVSNEALEEWNFQKIKTWTITHHYFTTNEVIIDLTPYNDRPLIIASDQALSIIASLRMAIAKRSREIQEGITTTRPIEFTYTGVQKYFQKIQKKVVLEISKLGFRVLEDKSDFVLSSFFSPDVLVQKSILEIKTFNQVGEDKFVVQFGNSVEQYVFIYKDPKAIMDSFKKVVHRKSKGEEYITSSSSDDTD